MLKLPMHARIVGAVGVIGALAFSPPAAAVPTTDDDTYTVDVSHDSGSAPQQPAPKKESAPPAAEPASAVTDAPTATQAGECVSGGTPVNCLAVSAADPGPGAPAAAAPPPPSPIQLAQQAATSVTITTPPISLDPYYLLNDGRRATLKNMQTWLWATTWQTLTPRVEVGPVWIEAQISPHTILVHPNDGTTSDYQCTGPGTPVPAGTPLDEPSPTCSLQFLAQTDGGTWPVQVQTRYRVTWVGFDGITTVSGTLPDLTSAPSTLPLAVLTAKPELIDANHD